MTTFVYVLNQTGRDNLRDALVGCLKASIDPEQYADAASNEAEVEVIGGDPEINVEVPARDNIHGHPFTISVAGPHFFNAEPLDA